MKVLASLIALLCLLVAVFAEIPVEDGVLVLGEDNFNDAITAHPNILVEFYAPWCGHCKALAPEYTKAAKALEGAPVKLAKVDATVNNDLAKSFEIRGFPTLKFFKNGSPSDYNGGRTESEIVSWLSKKTGPAATLLKSVEELEGLKESHEAFVVGVFASLDSDAAKTFVAAAEKDDIHIYAITSEEALRAKIAVDGDAVVVLKTFDDLRSDLHVTSSVSADDVIGFVLANTSPLVQEFSPETSKKIFGSKIMNHVLFFTDTNSPSHASILASYREVAGSFKGKALFVNVPTSENKVLEYFDIDAQSVPAMVVADLSAPSGIKKFKYSGDHSAESVKAFVSSFFSGELKPFLKSEEPEEGDTAGDVTVLRGTTFKDLVLNNDKDVFVEFYAPWCGHCAKLAPIWDDLGKQVKATSDKVVIAKMDATANEVDVPGMAVQGFPTIFFFKGNKKEQPMKYGGGRTLEDFLSYLEENAHHSFSRDEL